MPVEETPCPRSPDGKHCRHWYDGDECCFCADPAMTEAQRVEQGMAEGPMV